MELGHESSVVGVARVYAEVCGTLVIDDADADLAGAVEAEGVRAVVAPTIMKGPDGVGGPGPPGAPARRAEAVTVISVIPIEGIPEVRQGDNLADLILAACADEPLADGRRARRHPEGRVQGRGPARGRRPGRPAVPQGDRRARGRAHPARAGATCSSPRPTHGFVCANAGIDLSNVERGYAALLPVDSDRSARKIRDGLRAKGGVSVGVIVSDTFGRTWRRGVTDVAIGCAGIAAVVDLRGTEDAYGRELMVTEVCVADELAAAAELVMGKSTGVAVAIVRGVNAEWLREGSVKGEVVRRPDEDLFR